MPLPILLLRKRKLRHSLGRPSRSDFVQLEFMEEMNMKNYKILSKAILAICLFGIILTIINSFTSFINSSISTSGTIICISSFIVAGVAIMLLENRKIKTVKRDR